MLRFSGSVDLDSNFKSLICALLTQAIEDALFLRRVGSIDDNLEVTGKLPIIYRHSQWPKDRHDVSELADFFTDGRLERLLSLASIDVDADKFRTAAASLPVDTQLRQRLASLH